MKQMEVVLIYSEKVLEETECVSNIILCKSMGKLIRRLVNVRINCGDYYELSKNSDKKNQEMFTLRRATKNLGKLL